jgi:recyclin-1
MDLGPTEGCREAIACLEMHCNLLKGSTSKEVLEVFYQEVGIRLQQYVSSSPTYLLLMYRILQRHLKRQIISLEGGFQIIADLNAYHAFVTSLKQQRITDDFANLKMLGHVYIVSDAKDLAQIVRDVTRYGGTFTPEE